MTRRLFALARDSRLALALTVLFGLLAGGLAIGQASALSTAVARVFLDGASRAEVWPYLGLILVLVAGRGLLAWGIEVSAHAVARRVKTDLRERLFDKILSLGPVYTRGERSGELTSAAVEGIEALEAYFSQYLPQLLIAALVPLSILVFVFPADILSGLVLLLTAPLIPLFMVLIGKAAEALTGRQYALLGRLSAHFLDSLQGLETLKQFGRARDQVESLRRSSERFRDVTLSVLRVTFLSALALELIATLSTAVVAVEIGLRLLAGGLPFARALFLLVLAPEFYLPLRMLGLRFHAGMAGVTAARRIFAILDVPAATALPPLPSAVRGPGTVRLRSVAFTYPGERQPALQDVSLTIQAGEHLALVGPSGAGKSTLAALLLGFIVPATGEISLDGRPAAQVGESAWRRTFAWVPQAPYLFHDTIAGNLRIARKAATPTEMHTALQAAGLEEFVASLPEGLETVIGEQGARLSGGQAQRLALARAFLRDAPVLVLDEPTSSLDPGQEALVESATRRLMRGRTVLTIAHRLNTTFRADRILVLDKGRLVETGTHRQLLERGGLYARMVGPAAGVFSAVEERLPSETSGANLAVDSYSAAPVSQSSTGGRKPGIAVQLLSFLRSAWDQVALSVLLGALTVGASVGLLGASSWLIATAALQPSIADLQVAIVGVRFFGLGRGFFRYLERLVSHNVTFRLLTRLRVWFYEQLEPLAPARLMGFRAGDLLNRIIADVATLENFYVRVVAPPLVALVIVLAMTLFLGRFDPALAWAYLACALALGLLVPILTRILGCGPGKDLVHTRATLRVCLLDGIQGLADLLAFGQAADYRHRVRQAGEACEQAGVRLARVTGLAGGAGVLFAGLGMWSVLFLAIPLATAGSMDGVLLPVLALMALASFEALLPLPAAAQNLSASLEAGRRLFEFVEHDQAPLAIPLPVVAGQGPPVPDLQIANLTFTYPGSLTPALQEVCLALPPGRRLAVIGPSGAGKSTLVNLLLRFWDPPEGSIHLGGRDLSAVLPEQAREHFSVISQRTYLFNVSVRENLLLAKPEATWEQVEQAAREAQLHEFILDLPQGYETVVGEHGLRLSGGERQRLALARALLKDAPILLLDEPTANLDPLIERRILERILAAGRGRSLLLITHRLVALEAMDEIVVLDGGGIVERGTHAALLDGAGLYLRLWNLQNRIFLQEVG
ncbi:MAG: thiol reductant ABC exporter subunit CydD [Anaerolineales bacterium]|nr:thiol reductant ABC exporter subunit CydD [Anaerolineales bacterium]